MCSDSWANKDAAGLVWRLVAENVIYFIFNGHFWVFMILLPQLQKKTCSLNFFYFLLYIKAAKSNIFDINNGSQ